MKKKIVIAVGGSSGSIYTKVLLDKLMLLKNQTEAIGLVMTENARYNWQHELENADWKNYDVHHYEKNDFMAPFASGSARYDTMIICPCSMGLLARMAHGVSDDLITRAADVILKERRKLIIVPREAPYSLIHINNMKTLTEAGGIICPATPNFYSRPKTLEDVAATVVDRVLDLAGFESDTFRWNDI